MRENRLVTPLILAAVVALFVLSFVIGGQRQRAGEDAFGGTDAAVTSMLEEAGHEPWVTPIFEPGSTELESGLFALQAALGAGVLGFALGNLRGRSAERAVHGEASTDS